MLTQAILKENLHYSNITGEFYRLKSTAKNKVKVGDVAGTLSPNGYRYIRVNGKQYLAHRLAWLYVTGQWPDDDIDHINGIRDANYWLNLREATRSQNMHNKGMHSNNTSGYKGITWYKAYQKWRAQIMLNSKGKHIGYFDDIEVAYSARLQAEKELHGEFARI